MRDGKRVVITYGTYDMFHFGHVALLERARALGDYLIVGVTSDEFDRVRGKLNVVQPLAERIEAVRATGLADMVIAEEYQGQKISDIRKYGVDVFAIGSDWEGKFDFLNKYCEVVYLKRTEGVSSTELRAETMSLVKLGCVGSDYLVGRLVDECSHVAGVEMVCGFSPDGNNGVYAAAGIEQACSLEDLLERVDAVYISVPINLRDGLIASALGRNCHVLCESPLFLSEARGKQLLDLARSKGLVLMEALKTLYFPAFDHLRLLLASGVVGEIKDIDASFSHVFDELDKDDVFQGSFYDMASYITLPAVTLLGDAYLSSDFACRFEGDFCTWTKLSLLYETASATLRVGRGMKTEGSMIITGTDGYVYVPAPWWKTEYFEVRGEDLRDIKKYFFGYAGQGQRYEVSEFARLIRTDPPRRVLSRSEADVLAVTRLVERFHKGDVARLGNGPYVFGGGETVKDR